MHSIPETFPINHDDYHANHIGWTADGRQFFLTAPFVAATDEEAGSEYLALFTFDANGTLLDSIIDNLGARSTLDMAACSKLYQQRLASLGDVKFCDIRIAPFKVERFGIEFGLIPYESEYEEEELTIEMQPGNYMAFYAPWDGNYDT